jgi:hypothetical protein
MAYTNHGNIRMDGDGPITVFIDGAPCDNIRVVNSTAGDTERDLEVSLTLNPDRDDDGTPFIIRAQTNLTLAPGGIYGFTIAEDSGVSDVVDVIWW